MCDCKHVWNTLLFNTQTETRFAEDMGGDEHLCDCKHVWNTLFFNTQAETRFAEDMGGDEHDGVTLEWDPMDRDADPSARFPMGC